MGTSEHRSGIYLRISDDKEGLELGVGRQHEDCLSLSDRLHRIVYKIYKDNDISASTRSRQTRPEYQQLLEDARNGLIDTIIAYKSSRLTRRPRENEDLITLAEQYGVKFYYVASPSFDLNTADGRFVARAMAAVDAQQAEVTAELIARKKLEKATKGQYMGGARAYGFEGPIKDEHGTLINRGRINVAILEDEKAVWLDCVQRVIAGERETDLIRDLNARGNLSSTGTLWQTGNLKHVLLRKRFVEFDATGHPADCPCLTNPEGNGTLTHRGIEHRAVWPAFISQETHAQLAAAFEVHSQPWAHGLIKGRKYLLSGLAVCGRCGTPMYGQHRKIDENRKQRRYRCKGRDNHAMRLGCGKVFRDEAALDEYVTEAVFERFDSPEVARVLAPKEDEERAAALGQQLAGQKARRTQLLAEYGRGEHEKADYRIMLGAADEAIEKTQAELAKLHATKVAGIIPAHGLLQEVWDASSLEWRRNVIRLVIERIVVNPRTPGAPKWHGHLFNPNDIEIVWVTARDKDVVAALQALVQSTRRSQAVLGGELTTGLSVLCKATRPGLALAA
jgi:DNA invertase Pin-like site-specific DNA recombinase